MADIGYYQPYESESESDTGSSEESSDESEFWSTSEEEEALITSPVSLLRTAGPAFADQKDALLESRTNPYSSVDAAFAPPERMGNIHDGVAVGTTKFNIQPRSVESIINVASQDRDYAVYSNPTAFTLHLPRVYRNVTNFDIQQIKFLNAFYYFRNDKFNTYYDYVEVGRPHFVSNSNLYDNLQCNVANREDTPLTLRVRIREGSYNITSLLQELQYQLNTPPLFFYYRNGFNDFAPLFSASGNYAFNFNYAGSYYFDSLLNTFIANPTTAQVIQHYFPSTNAGLDFYDLNRTLNAYFYPVIKEVFLDPVALPQLDLTNPAIPTNLLPEETVEMRILYNFQGLDDPVPLAIIEDNRKFLELYRTQNTYLYAPINEYSFRVDSYNNRVTIYSTSLQKSIVNYMTDSLCNAYRSQFLSNGLDSAGVQYNALISSNNKLLAIISQMKDYVYNEMANWFAVPFNTYTFNQLLDYTTLYNFQNGIGACNIPTSNTYWNIDTVVIPASNYNETSATPIQYDSYSNTTTCNFNIINNFDSNKNNKNYQIDVDSSYIVPNPNEVVLVDTPLIDTTTSNLIINPKKRSLDIICDVNPYEYSVYTFKSSCRQTIQVETIPIPHKFRYFSNAQSYGTFISNYFSTSNYFCNTHPYLSNIQSNLTAINANMNTSNIPVVFNQNYSNASNASSTYIINTIKKYGFFKFTMPDNPTYTGSLHNITASLSLTAAEIASEVTVYLYADKASFLNDQYIYYRYLANNSNLLSNLSSNYIYSNSWNGNETFIQDIELQNSTEYYIIVAQNNIVNSLTLNYKIFVWFNNPAFTRQISYDLTGNPSQSTIPFYFQSPESNARMYEYTNVYTNFDYYLIYDYVYNRLPITSNLSFSNNPSCNTFNNSIQSGLIPIGYDSNGVSQDLTDYKGFPTVADLQTSITRIDPTNNYLFKFLTPYSYDSTNCNTYLPYKDPTSNCNEILVSNSAIKYNYDIESYFYSGAKRQYKIVHWHDQCHIPPQYFDTLFPVILGSRTPWQSGYSAYNNHFSKNIQPYLSSMIDFSSISFCNWDFSNTPSNAYFSSSYSNCNNFITNLYGVSGIGFLPTDGSWDIESFMYKSACCNASEDPNTQIEYIGVFDAQTVSKYNVSQIDITKALYILNRSNAVYYNDSNFVNDSNFGFDCNFGSYHIFHIDSNSINSNTEGRMAGYTQMYTKAITDERSFYTLIPFSSTCNILTYTMLCGSVVHNPDLAVSGSNSAKACNISSNGAINEYCNRTVNMNPYFIAGCNAPVYIPRTVSDPTGQLGIEVSKYQQSLPIVTQPVQIIQFAEYIKDISANYNTIRPTGSPSPNLLASNYKLTYSFDNQSAGTGSKLCLTPNGISNTSTGCNFNITTNPPDPFFSNTMGLFNINCNVLNYSTMITSVPPQGLYTSCNILGFTEGCNCRLLLVNYTGIVPNRYEYFNINNYKLNTYSLGTSAGFFSNVSNYNYTSNYFFMNNTTSIFGSNLIYHLNYNATNSKLIILNPNPSVTYCNYIYIDQLPGISNITAAYAQSSDPAHRNFMILNNDIGAGTTSLYMINPDMYDPITSNVTCYELVFSASYQGKIIDAKIDQYNSSNIYFIYSDDPYHLHLATMDQLVGSNNISNVNGNPAITYTVLQYSIKDTVSAFSFSNSLLDPVFSWTLGYSNNFFYNWTVPSATLPWNIKGTNNKEQDKNFSLNTLYNWFYPNFKVILNKKTNYYNSITDVQNLLSNPYDQSVYTPEFGRTHTFFYETGTNFSNDIVITGAPNKYKWGMENSNNYYRADTDSAGYVFGSYIYNITLDATDSNETRYLAIRGERPTEQFATMLRIVAPERVDFGFVAMSNIFNEISNIYYPVSGGTPSPNEKVCNYNPDYAANLSNFDQAFAMSNRYFGGGEVSNFYGVPITTSNNPAISSNFFFKFMSNLSNYYSNYSSNLTIISSIQCNAQFNFSNIIYNAFGDIFPGYIFGRQNITEPAEFNLLFVDSIPEGRYKTLDEGWGLGWNLGFEKSNYSNDTVYTAESFYKIFEDYIFLRLNPEQNMNRVDYTSREHLDRTLDTQGTVQTYYGKLLLNTFGSYGTTFVGNPVEFNPPISRLDRLQIQWVDAAGNVLDNPDCEWNAVLHISENTPTATIASTIPTLERMDGAQQQQQKSGAEKKKEAEGDKKKTEEEQQKTKPTT